MDAEGEGIQRLSAVDSAPRFGAKAARLGAAERAGLPVPPGFAIATDVVARLIDRGDGIATAISGAAAELGRSVSVRSSAVLEDGSGRSFAGLFRSILNVTSPERVPPAVVEVAQSGEHSRVAAYRERLGVVGSRQVAVIVQEMIDARCAGVLFTVDPMSGADDMVIESAWGVGEAVAAGSVAPDRLRLTRDGLVTSQEVGRKKFALRLARDGGLDKIFLDEQEARALSLSKAEASRLHGLGLACERLLGQPCDLEWAFARDELYLLQVRPITSGSEPRAV